MKTADFLGTQPFLNHLQRQRTPRRLLALCLFSALCLSFTIVFEVMVRVEEKRAEAGRKPLPEAAAAQQELGKIFKQMDLYAQALDPLSTHLAKPMYAELLGGLDRALGPSVEVERVVWNRKPETDKKGRAKKGGPENVHMTVDAIVLDEETATTLADLLAAYTGYEATVDNAEPVPERWPATRMRIRLIGAANIGLPAAREVSS